MDEKIEKCGHGHGHGHVHGFGRSGTETALKTLPSPPEGRPPTLSGVISSPNHPTAYCTNLRGPSMPSLSSLIVQRQVATIAEVEQAIARQVIHGGDFLTNLLEVAPHAEQRAAFVLGELLGMPFAAAGRLEPPEDEVLALVPMELALRVLVFPLRVEDDALVVATSDSIGAHVEEDLRDMARFRVTFVAAPLIRIREGIAAHYGAPLDPRQLRLIELLDGVQRSGVSAPQGAPVSSAFAPSHVPLETRLPSGISSPPPAIEAAPPTRRFGGVVIGHFRRGHVHRRPDSLVVVIGAGQGPARAAVRARLRRGRTRRSRSGPSRSDS